MPASTYLGNMVLDAILRGQTFVVPSRVWVALHTVNPTVDGIGEVTGAEWPGYGRKDPANGGAISSGFSAAASKTSANTQLISYGEMNGSADLAVSYSSVWDAQIGGNMLVYGPLTTPRIFAPSDEAVIKIGKLTEAVI